MNPAPQLKKTPSNAFITQLLSVFYVPTIKGVTCQVQCLVSTQEILTACNSPKTFNISLCVQTEQWVALRQLVPGFWSSVAVCRVSLFVLNMTTLKQSENNVLFLRFNGFLPLLSHPLSCSTTAVALFLFKTSRDKSN